MAATQSPKATANLALALGLHAALIGAMLGWGLLDRARHPHWGDRDPTAGAIQASMVSALPLPPRQPVVDKAVLASDKPSPAPTPPAPAPPEKAKPAPAPKTEAPPKPDAIPIPAKAAKPAPAKADTPVPTPAKTPAPPSKAPPTPTPSKSVQPTPPTPKATTGDSAGIQIPQSTTELKNGTATLTVDERAFGDRYAYYVRLIAQKINQSKSQGDADPPDARGKRTVVRFTIDRDGTPQDAEVTTKSGSAALDTNTLRAIQRIDSFGPLPAGDHITITFGFTDK